MKKDIFSEPPDSEPYFDHEVARNVLLHFIHDNGLDDQFMAYLEKYAPEDEDGYRT